MRYIPSHICYLVCSFYNLILEAHKTYVHVKRHIALYGWMDGVDERVEHGHTEGQTLLSLIEWTRKNKVDTVWYVCTKTIILKDNKCRPWETCFGLRRIYTFYLSHWMERIGVTLYDYYVVHGQLCSFSTKR